MHRPPSYSAVALAARLLSLPSLAGAQAAAGNADRSAAAGAPLIGRYGCTQSVYSRGSYSYEGRGSVTLLSGGAYRYVMGTPGRYRYDAVTGTTSFAGGFLDGATATAIDGKRNRLFITTDPKNGRGRWGCSKAD
jgi:hypothetical protein